MRILILCAILALGHLAVASEASQAREAFRESVRICQLTAKTSALGAEQAANLDRLIGAARAHLAALETDLEALKKANDERREALKQTSRALARDADALAAFSRFLDGFYARVLSEVPSGTFPAGKEPAKNLDGKLLPEKLRAVLALLQSLKDCDCQARVLENGEFCTGVFVRARGPVKGEVSVLGVSGKGGLK